MPTITAGDFRNGVTFEKDGSVCTVVEFQHVKPGKGAAFVRTKYKNVMTGAIREESFNPTAKFEQATVERKDAEYSYNDGDLYYFMDPETYDMVPLNRDVLGDAFQLREGEHRVQAGELQGQRVHRGSAQLHGPGGHGDRARREGRHRHQRDQARDAGDRR